MKKQVLKKVASQSKLQQVTKDVGRKLYKNSPTILTGLAVAGLISTTIMAVQATPKATQILVDSLEEDDYRNYIDNPERPRVVDFYDKWDIVKLTWPCYVPTIIMGGLTVSCILSANSINLKRNAAIASMYSLTEATLKEYQAKVVETIGENKARKIKDEVRQDRLEKDKLGEKEVFLTNRGEMLCYDYLSGRYFRSDIEQIRRIQNDLNRELILDGWTNLNGFYYALGLSAVKMGDEIGWSSDNLIELDFSSMLADNNEPCLVVDYVNQPKQQRGKHYR